MRSLVVVESWRDLRFASILLNKKLGGGLDAIEAGALHRGDGLCFGI